MTIFKAGNGRTLTGMVGGIVVAERNGKPYMRKAPVRTKNSWTPAQVLHRQRFKEINRFCKLFKDTVIPQIWNHEAQQMSGYTLFLKTNSAAFAPDGTLEDPKNIQLSTGKLALFKDLQARRAAEEATVEVNWQRGPLWGGKYLSEELMAISAAGDIYSDITATGLLKHHMKGSFKLPALSVPPTHIYLFTVSKDRRDYSASVCFEI